MNLKQINETLDHKITDGSEYTWNCYPDARFLEYESDYAHVSVIFSTINQTVYEAEVSVKRDAWDNDMRPYRWLNPDTKDIMIAEAKKRKVKYRKAWDDVKYIDLDLEEDFLEKAKAIFNKEPFDTRIQMEVDLDDETLVKLAVEAHKRDITINKYIEEVLQAFIDKEKLSTE
jgi:predicted HicB family RNase H-like nuclease